MSEQTSADELKTALRNAMKATPKTPHCFVLVPKGGSDGALLVDKRKIAAARIDAAKKALGVSTVVRGTCFGEEGKLVFQTVKPQAANAAALVKKIAQVKAGVGIKPEFRLGQPGEVDDDDENPLDVEAAATAAKPAAPVVGKAAAPPAKPADAAFQARLAALVPRVKAAIAAGHPAATELKLKASQAVVASNGKDAAKAAALLDEIEALLSATGGRTPSLGADWQAAVAAYRAASDTVDGQITVLQGRLRSSGDPELAEIADKGLNGVTGNFKVPLLAVLRDLEGARGDAVAAHARRAVQIAAGFVKHIESAPTVAACDSNPLAPVSIRATLGPVLRQMARAAAAAA